MRQFHRMSDEEIVDAMEEILGRERWESIRYSIDVNSVIKSSTSLYEAAERINCLAQSDPKDLMDG